MSGMLGKKHSEKAKAKMRKAKLGVFDGKKNPFYGKKHSEKTRKKMRQAKLNNPTRYWLGKKRDKNTIDKIIKANTLPDEELKYSSIHTKITKNYGTPKYCEICKSTNKKIYDWSNKDHKYSLKRKDWQRLCRSCHIKYDIKYNNLGKKYLKLIS